MDEKTFYSDNSVQVTSSRVVMPGTTYALRNISSVRTLVFTPSHSLDIALIVIGIIILLIGISSSAGAAFVGLILAGAGIALFMTKKPDYLVRLGTNAGEQDGIRSKDKVYIDRIVNAINESIISKG